MPVYIPLPKGRGFDRKSDNFLTKFDPMRPVPPVTKIFMTFSPKNQQGVIAPKPKGLGLYFIDNSVSEGASYTQLTRSVARGPRALQCLTLSENFKSS